MHRAILTIVVFMLGLTVSPANSEEQNDDPARKLINSQGCKACHILGGDGGTVAGSFENMREKLTRSEVLSQLVNPEHKHGNSTIPDFSHLSDKEIDVLVDFIQPNQ